MFIQDIRDTDIEKKYLLYADTNTVKAVRCYSPC